MLPPRGAARRGAAREVCRGRRLWVRRDATATKGAVPAVQGVPGVVRLRAGQLVEGPTGPCQVRWAPVLLTPVRVVPRRGTVLGWWCGCYFDE
jgi:hypothetical protein